MRRWSLLGCFSVVRNKEDAQMNRRHYITAVLGTAMVMLLCLVPGDLLCSDSEQ